MPRSVADLATKLILAIHYRDPTGSDEHLGIDAPEPSADRLAAEMELDCLDHILAMVPPAPANAAEWAAAEAKLLQADTALDALPDGYTDQDVNELSEIRSDAIDTILALPAETAAQAVRKLELAMFDESAVLTRVDHPALLAEAKRLIGRAA